MIRQVVYVALDGVESPDDRTKAIEAACNWDWLAEYRLVEVTPYSNWDGRTTGVEKPAAGAYGYYLFFEKD